MPEQIEQSGNVIHVEHSKYLEYLEHSAVITGVNVFRQIATVKYRADCLVYIPSGIRWESIYAITAHNRNLLPF